MKILLDTNVLIYSINSDSPKHTLAQRYIRAHQQDLYIAHQNILEGFRVLTHTKYPNPMRSSDAIDAIWNIATALRIIYPQRETLLVAKDLIGHYLLTADQIFDAYLAATALSNNIKTIVTDNVKDFIPIQEVTTISLSRNT